MSVCAAGNPTGEVAEWQCVPASEGLRCKEPSCKRKVEPVDKAGGKRGQAAINQIRAQWVEILEVGNAVGGKQRVCRCIEVLVEIL